MDYKIQKCRILCTFLDIFVTIILKDKNCKNWLYHSFLYLIKLIFKLIKFCALRDIKYNQMMEKKDLQKQQRRKRKDP